MIAGCTVSRSVRTGSQIKYIPQKLSENTAGTNQLTPADQSDENDPAEEQKSQAVKGIPVASAQAPVSTDNSGTNAPVRRIPTLREQIKSIQDKQDEFGLKVSGIESELNDLKETVSQLKNDVHQISVKQQGKKADNDIIKSTFISDEKYNSSLLLPDEKSGSTSTRKKIISKQIVNESQTGQPGRQLAQIYNPAKNKSSKKSLHESEKNVEEQSPAELKDILKEIDNKNYNNAVTQLNILLKSSQGNAQKSQCYFYLGESYYGMRQYKQASDYYNLVLKSGNPGLKEKSQAKIAECYIRNGDIQPAKSAYQELISKYPESEYVPIARKMLQQL